MKRRWLNILLPVLLAAALLFGGIALAANDNSSVFFMSINDTVKPTMTKENMPLFSGNVLYVPYTMFSPQHTGVNLGVRAQYNSSRGVLTVTNDVQTVTFDLRSATAYTSQGNTISARALVRNDTVFVPVDWLCGYFRELRYSMIHTPYGTLIRVSNNDVVLTDAQFVRDADLILRQIYQDYQASLVPTPTPTPSPKPSPSPSPSPKPSPSPSPSPSPRPSPTPSPSPSPSVPPKPAPLVYLALRDAGQSSRAADILELLEQRALFLFDVDQLAGQDDLLRRLVARGHQIGLVLSGGDTESCLAELARGRQLLADIARCPVLILSAPELKEQEAKELARRAGCALWSPTREGSGQTPSQLLRRLRDTDSSLLELNCDDEGIGLLTLLLPELIGNEFRLEQILAPILTQ